MQPQSDTDTSESLCDLLPEINRDIKRLIKERKIMAFVNEYATDEDIEKYDLNGIWDQYHPLRKGKYYLGQRPWLTIDRGRNIYFMIVGGGGREDPEITRVLLWIDGYHVIIEIGLVSGLNPEGFEANPYRITWNLLGVYPQKNVGKSQKEIITLLKEALTVYGCFGVHMQVPNTIVEFNF
ncbi:MAG: hypothetical protein N0E59_00560 [Candidatus Thiodiazotropha taylori]|nr:hypothetical protein [Candidatus Thiodiazotropha taylori]MCG8028858.1 hypothetical protein [Candidatus Thiodiazotropha taylori]MCG8080613.1 hypothetical protein [Candidatus Thiodiazotropha taylori]MCG8105094.1 hypothetical protein [Candidatus Thiodiazotropha taylori]MCG8109236.1 hypothetical protein [Candidatus Thiodiazotropha taylori]